MGETNIGDVIAELHQGGKTGVLSLSIRDDNNQLKFFLQDGAVYHVTYSTCRNIECLIKLCSLKVEKGFFLPGAKVDVPHTIVLRTEDIIDQVKNLGKVISWAGTGGRDGRQAPANDAVMISGPELHRLEEDILDLIGPAGSLVLERAFTECGIQKDAAISKMKFAALVRTVSRQIPEEQRKKLFVKYSF